MTLVLFLPFGLLIGAVARMLIPRAKRGGWVPSMLIGAAGGVLGGWIGRFVQLSGEGDPAGFVASLLGATILVIAYHVATVRRTRAMARYIRQD